MKSDFELMSAYRKGDAAAFESLVRRHRARVFEYLRSIVRDKSLAEDALIETFFKLHRAAATYKPLAAFRVFLFTIARREAINVLRSNRKGSKTDSMSISDGRGGLMSQDIQCPSPGPAAAFTRKQALAAVDRALETLPEGQRAVFLLFYREGLSTDEIAEVTDLSGGSVRAYLTKARARLREILSETLDVNETLGVNG